MTVACLAALGITLSVRGAIQTFETEYARVQIDEKGNITSLVSVKSGKEYSPAGHPSPLMSLHEYGKTNDDLIFPVSAAYNAGAHEFTVKYPNGATAVVKAAAKKDYFRFQLESLTPRGEVDNIVWGPLHTTVSKKIGDIIGVVRDDDWAVGMFGLDENTIAGPPTEGDCYGMGYYIHSPDPKKIPLPAKYHEGQWFNIGGNGINDVAFYSHPEEYFQQIFGTGAKLEPEYGSTVSYHSRDRRKVYTYCWSLLPGFDHSRPRHQVSDPVDVDFTGSAVALYACPDGQGLHVLENIVLGEELPHIVINGKWIRDPSAYKPQLFWNGPYDKCLEYAKALGFKDVSRDTAEFYASRGNNWTGGGAKFSDGRTMAGLEFLKVAHAEGMTTYGGLHTLCLFLQGGICRDVTPVPSVHLQTVCRTRLANDISETDTTIVVTDPSFLAEKGTWPRGDDSNYLQIGDEMLRYDGITASAPYTLVGVKRGHASKALAHKAGDVVAKLQLNCYNGFCPDMALMPEYADYYADLMARNGLECIDFDGLESTVYLNQGYYGVEVFFRRLFDTYAKLTGGKRPRVTASNVYAGSWLYMDACNVGGGDNMFNAASGRWATEGKDIRNGFENSYYPGTFGIQSWHSDWSLYDAENLEAKSIGWDATYAFSVSQSGIDNTGEKEAIFKAFHAWENAREGSAFNAALKEQLQDSNKKFHLEQTGDKSFVLYPIQEVRLSESADSTPKPIALANAQDAQPLQFALRLEDAADGCDITLPDGSELKSDKKIERGQFIVFKGNQAYVGDHDRKKLADLVVSHAVQLPKGDSKLSVQFSQPGNAKVRFGLTVWIAGAGEQISAL